MCNLTDVCHSTLQMLTNIENRLEELFEEIENLPPEKVEAAEKVNHVCSIQIKQTQERVLG